MFRVHKSEETENQKAFKCKICDSCFSNTKDYFQHINSHLKSFETIECVFDGCDFKTNIYGTYAIHKSRKHQAYSCNDLKADIIVQLPISTSVQQHGSQFALLESVNDVELDTSGDLDCEGDTSVFEKVIGCLAEVRKHF